MKFGLSVGEEDIWFAWRPVRLNNGKIAWLEKVTRRRDGYFGGFWYYYSEVNI